MFIGHGDIMVGIGSHIMQKARRPPHAIHLGPRHQRSLWDLCQAPCPSLRHHPLPLPTPAKPIFRLRQNLPMLPAPCSSERTGARRHRIFWHLHTPKAISPSLQALKHRHHHCLVQGRHSARSPYPLLFPPPGFHTILPQPRAHIESACESPTLATFSMACSTQKSGLSCIFLMSWRRLIISGSAFTSTISHCLISLFSFSV